MKLEIDGTVFDLTASPVKIYRDAESSCIIVEQNGKKITTREFSEMIPTLQDGDAPYFFGTADNGAAIRALSDIRIISDTIEVSMKEGQITIDEDCNISMANIECQLISVGSNEEMSEQN